jgi:glucose/arabinose dehydrogenase
VSMQAHSAPLDIKFYPGGSFPAEMVGDAIISFHGSWNRNTATGYKVVRVPFGGNGMPSGDPVPLLESAGDGDTGGGWGHRPVGLAVGTRGQVFISSDESGAIIALGHDGT